METTAKKAPEKVRKAKIWFRRIIRYFNILPDKESECETVQVISSGVKFRGANLWVLIFAILIASLGLNVNSTAVIIGAMLISPLMGPILGAGLALAIKDYGLLRRSVKNYASAMLISVVTATLYFLITPFEGEQSELLARTSPTFYDVLIAFFGGMAGVVAVCTRGKGNVIPGVAIATALMPPLCTAGYGLATMNWAYFFGAFYLFFINTIFIGLSTYLVVKVLHFECSQNKLGVKYSKIGRFISVGIVLSLVPAFIMTFHIVRDTFLEKTVARYVAEELKHPGTEILNYRVDKEKRLLEVVAVGRIIRREDIRKAEERMDRYKMEGFSLSVVQGEQGDSLMRISEVLKDVKNAKEVTREMLNIQTEKVKQLTRELNDYTRFSGISGALREEMKVLFPEIQSLQLGMVESIEADSTGKGILRPLAVVRLRKDSVKSSFSWEKFREWLQVRVHEDQLQLVRL